MLLFHFRRYHSGERGREGRSWHRNHRTGGQDIYPQPVHSAPGPGTRLFATFAPYPAPIMNIQIRRAEPRDVPRMFELVEELALFERAPEAVTVTLEHMLDAGFGSDPVWMGWVAERSSDKGLGEVVGMAVCYERYSTWKGRRLYLEDIVVTESARGQGIGEALFRACAAYALERGHSGMVWQVLDWNEGAIRFYERLGAEFDKGWWNGSLDRPALARLAGRD
jgi:ribosomal protein S18 acetylase RimI-like enzyme